MLKHHLLKVSRMAMHRWKKVMMKLLAEEISGGRVGGGAGTFASAKATLTL